jgi:hypothetical protein
MRRPSTHPTTARRGRETLAERAKVIPGEEHLDLNTTNLQGNYSGTPRGLMANTLSDLRNYTATPNSSLWKLLNIEDHEYSGVLSK